MRRLPFTLPFLALLLVSPAVADDPKPVAPKHLPAVEKTSVGGVRGLRAARPDTAVEVRAEDETRLGLKPTIRRAWWRRGWAAPTRTIRNQRNPRPPRPS